MSDEGGETPKNEQTGSNPTEGKPYAVNQDGTVDFGDPLNDPEARKRAVEARDQFEDSSR